MEIDGEGGGGKAERRGRSELGRLLLALGSEVLEKRIPLIKQLEEFCADDLDLILQVLLASWIDSTCSGVSHCTLHRSILQVALKCSDLDITDYLGQFLSLGAKASSWCGRHLQWFDQSQVVQEEEHNRLCLEINSLSFSISTKLHGIAAKRFTVLGLAVAAGEGGQGAAQEECVFNKADDAFPTLETMAVEVELAPAHLAVGATPWSLGPLLSPATQKACTHCKSEEMPRWLRGPDGPGTLCNACGLRFFKGRLLHSYSRRRQSQPSKKKKKKRRPSKVSRRCTHCAAEKTPRWLLGPDGPGTLCSACGQRFYKWRLLHSNSGRRRGRPSKKRGSSSKENLAADKDVAALAEALPCGVGASLDAFFDHTALEVSWQEAGPARAEEEEEEELEWLSNKDAFPSVETMAVEVEEAPALYAPPARTKGRQRVTANAVLRRRPCTHCGTAETPQWRDGPEGAPTLCNACGVVFKKKGRLLPEYRPANSPAFSPQLHSNKHHRALEMHSQNGPTSSSSPQRTIPLSRVLQREEETSAAGRATLEACCGEARHESMEVQLLPVPERPPANSPAFSLLPRSRSRRKSEVQTFNAIRATAKARRAERAAARLAAMDN